MTIEIEVNEGPDGRWFWSVGAHSGEERTRDAAYDRARDVQSRLRKMDTCDGCGIRVAKGDLEPVLLGQVRRLCDKCDSQ